MVWILCDKAGIVSILITSSEVGFLYVIGSDQNSRK